MPFAFKLPTTSFLTFQDFVSSSTHPSLPQEATIQRGLVRQALKEYKRLPDSSRASQLNNILVALNGYLPYLLALDSGLSGGKVGGDETQVDLEVEVEIQWRATLTSAAPGREATRVKLRSFDSVTPTLDQRTSAISAARKHFLEANSLYNLLSNRARQLNDSPPVPDISTFMFEALASLCRAEATLAAVLKDDPYPSAVVQDRNPNDKEWMIKPPDLPKVRAHLFARLCIAAAEHASKGIGALSTSRDVMSGLVKYMEDLKRTARAKACRFIGIDSEISSKTGEGIAWLGAARKELANGIPGSGDKTKSSVLSKLKKEFSEKREDKKVERGSDWGSDAGRFEEGRIVDMLTTKWTKMNDTMIMQNVPPSEPLIAQLPSGREFDTPTSPWKPRSLDENILAQMRALPDPGKAAYRAGDDDSDDDQTKPSDPIGAYPGTGAAYSKSSNYY